MDDTHSFEEELPTSEDAGDPVAALADLDPADAPAAAERYAASLAEELEEAGASPSQPVQLQADLGTDSAT